jgi:hypothetical protein
VKRLLRSRPFRAPRSTSLETAPGQLAEIQWGTVERQVATNRKELLRRQVPQARQVLKKLLVEPIVFTPNHHSKARHYTFSARISLRPLFTGMLSVNGEMVFANIVASPKRPRPGHAKNRYRLGRGASGNRG